jgi:hypothetical protein
MFDCSINPQRLRMFVVGGKEFGVSAVTETILLRVFIVTVVAMIMEPALRAA